MLTPEQIELRLDKILLRVQKPGRYVGGELNSVQKDWDSIQTKVALVFPDIYDIGVSNVGLKILYDQVNQRADALAERAYAPWFGWGEPQAVLAPVPSDSAYAGDIRFDAAANAVGLWYWGDGSPEVWALTLDGVAALPSIDRVSNNVACPRLD